jgi:hypothetical protein
MIAAVVTTAAVAAASAFVPAIPIEAYLVAVITTTGTDPVPLGIAAEPAQAMAGTAHRSARIRIGGRCAAAPHLGAHVSASRWPANGWPPP